MTLATPLLAHPRGLPALDAATSSSLARRCALALVWLTIASSGVVFSEPAPVDALTLGLVVLLPVIGLTRITPSLVTMLALWLVVGATGLLAAPLASGRAKAVTQTAVPIFLYAGASVLAAFVAARPQAHARLVLDAWTWAATIAAATALTGYFSLVPGAEEQFTRFGRGSGTFKDPNVLGAFLVLPILYALHRVLHAPLPRALIALGIAGMLGLALLVTFSRGAWINLALAVVVYGWLSLVTTRQAIVRWRLAAAATLAALTLAGLLGVAMQDERIASLLAERASLTQSYDVGPEGRFGGQGKALDLVALNPLGIGALEFAATHHHEEAHNVYLSMGLNAGWLGGGVYLVLVGLTLVLGARHLLAATAIRPLLIVAYAAFLAHAVEGLVIDTDHWRHFYLLMALVWGLMASAEPAPATPVPRPSTILRALRLPTLAGGPPLPPPTSPRALRRAPAPRPTVSGPAMARAAPPAPRRDAA